ncbi:MAG: NAD(P)H-binding protein [Polaribacter sp.]|uniref:NAD(P)H-binding protein n=1 Tax=Polaribacter sp. TaxID=1920175 RepID=UPI002F354BAD
MSKTAIILGATGLTGSILLEKLIANNYYKKIILFSRNSVTNTSTKIEEHLIDLLKLEEYKDQFIGDEVFCCIGTTGSKTKNKKLYKRIDYGIPVSAANLAKQNNINTFIVISSMGADVESSMFYNRTKGEMERDVLQQNIKNTFILRPSLIGGKRNEFRFGEKIGKGIMSILNPLFMGNLKKYKMIHPKEIANCMQILASKTENERIISSDKILTIANYKE